MAVTQRGDAPFVSGWAFKRRGSNATKLLMEPQHNTGSDATASTLFDDWWLGADASSGSVAITENADILSSASVLAIQASLAANEGNDVLSAVATLAVTAGLAATEGDDTLSANATGSVGINGSAALTEDSDTLSANGTLALQADAALTEDADALTSSAALAVQGTLGATEDQDGLTSVGSLALSGALDATEDADTLDASGESVVEQQQPGNSVGGGRSKSKQSVVLAEMIWPDDPRHPNNAANSSPVPDQPDQAPVSGPNVIKVTPRPTAKTAHTVAPALVYTDNDRAIALLLLAA